MKKHAQCFFLASFALLRFNTRVFLLNVAAMSPSRVEKCVEVMCHKGCKALWADIEALENGRVVEETSQLSGVERNQVLKELKSIMAVYEGSCDPD